MLECVLRIAEAKAHRSAAPSPSVGFGSLIADAMEHPPANEVKPAARDSGRGVGGIVEVVDGEHAKLGTGLKNVAFPGAGVLESGGGFGDGARPTGR